MTARGLAVEHGRSAGDAFVVPAEVAGPLGQHPSPVAPDPGEADLAAEPVAHRDGGAAHARQRRHGAGGEVRGAMRC